MSAILILRLQLTMSCAAIENHYDFSSKRNVGNLVKRRPRAQAARGPPPGPPPGSPAAGMPPAVRA